MKNLKNMKKILVFILLTVSLVSLNSCMEDILDQKPLGQNYSDVFWVNKQGAEKGLAGAYSLFRSNLLNGASYLMWGEFPGMFLLNTPLFLLNMIQNHCFLHFLIIMSLCMGMWKLIKSEQILIYFIPMN